MEARKELLRGCDLKKIVLKSNKRGVLEGAHKRFVRVEFLLAAQGVIINARRKHWDMRKTPEFVGRKEII